ncbi:MAG: hypothetical protein P4L51_01755 [Puia sp.]|nr:hypothetical protein [Puia sp.]
MQFLNSKNRDSLSHLLQISLYPMIKSVFPINPKLVTIEFLGHRSTSMAEHTELLCINQYTLDDAGTRLDHQIYMLAFLDSNDTSKREFIPETLLIGEGRILRALTLKANGEIVAHNEILLECIAFVERFLEEFVGNYI